MGIPYEKGSDTSKAAAEQKQDTAPSDEERVYHLIRSTSSPKWLLPLGITDDAIEAALNMRHQNASARRRALVLKGLVKDSGLRRKTRSGRLAAVWVTADTFVFGAREPEKAASQLKPDETKERYGQPRHGISVVVTRTEHNTYVSLERLEDGEWKFVPGSARGMGDRPVGALVESLYREWVEKKP